jgi:hypothetical protein
MCDVRLKDPLLFPSIMSLSILAPGLAAILIIPSELGCVYILLVIYITKKNIYIACDTAIRKLCLIWYWLISVF